MSSDNAVLTKCPLELALQQERHKWRSEVVDGLGAAPEDLAAKRDHELRRRAQRQP
jgi:hypothetical protein